MRSEITLSEEQALSLRNDSVHERIKKREARQFAIPFSVIQVSDGNRVITDVAAIRGSNINPELCEHTSIRWFLYRECPSKPEDLGDGIIFYPNYVHIPQNEKEVAVCEALFGRHFDEK
jgi:hypothetical protein